jgi:hypothetical protein
MAQPMSVCAYFILETARAIRRHPKNLKVGKTGVGLKRLYAAVSRIYSEEDFRAGIAALLADGRAILVCKLWEPSAEGEDLRSCFTQGNLRKIGGLPGGLPPGQYRKWALDRDGKIVDRKKVDADKHLCYEDPRLYILADGLPKTVERVK